MPSNREPAERLRVGKTGFQDLPMSPNDQVHHKRDLIALFRLLVREPGKEHDFQTCPTCRRHGITSI
jgi:hypothetical protein